MATRISIPFWRRVTIGFVFALIYFFNAITTNAQQEGLFPPQQGTGESYLISGSGGNSLVSGGSGTGVAGPVTVLQSNQYGYITTYQNSNGDTVTHYCSCSAGCCGSTSTPILPQDPDVPLPPAPGADTNCAGACGFEGCGCEGGGTGQK